MKRHVCDCCSVSCNNISVHEGFVLCSVCIGVLPFILPKLKRMKLVNNIITVITVAVIVVATATCLQIWRTMP